MDIYNWQLRISETEFFSTAIEKKQHLENSLSNAIENYETKKDSIEPYAVKTIQIGSKTIDLDNPPRPKITHKQAFELKYIEFKKEVAKALNSLCESVDIETEISNCEGAKTDQDKFFCYTRINKTYKEHLEQSKFLLETTNPEAYKNAVEIYPTYIQQIETRLEELKAKKSTSLHLHGVNKILTLKPNFDDPTTQINIIHVKSKPLFNATLEQWNNLFSENITTLKKPIELKQGVTLATLREFIKCLTDYKLIATRGALKTFADVNAFSFDNEVITARQLSDATKTINSPFYVENDKIKDIFEDMKLV